MKLLVVVVYLWMILMTMLVVHLIRSNLNDTGRWSLVGARLRALEEGHPMKKEDLERWLSDRR